MNLRSHADDTLASQRFQAPKATALQTDVRAARAGDRAAMERICTSAYRRVVAFYRYDGLRREDAEDLASTVVETIVAGLPRLRRPASYEAWMWSIARTKLRGWIRVNRRPARFERPSPGPATPDQLVELDEEHRLIRLALGRLSDRDRELLWLREVEELSYADIGGRLGAATGAIRVACMRARRRLEDAYATLAHLDGP